MSFYVAAVHLSGGDRHEHITQVIGVHDDYHSEKASTAEVVAYINKGNSVKVSDGKTTVEVDVVNANPPYIRTKADNKWTDNLLALPRY